MSNDYKSLIIDRLKGNIAEGNDIYTLNNYFEIKSDEIIGRGEINEINKKIIKDLLLGIDFIIKNVEKKMKNLLEGHFSTLVYDVEIFFRTKDTYLPDEEYVSDLEKIYPAVDRIILYQENPTTKEKKIILYTPYIEEIAKYLEIKK